MENTSAVKPIHGHYTITLEEPHVVIDTTTGLVLDEWYNSYGDEAVLIDGELYLISELLSI